MKFTIELAMVNGSWLYDFKNEIGLELIDKSNISESELPCLQEYISSWQQTYIKIDLSILEARLLAIKYDKLNKKNEIKIILTEILDKELFDIKLDRYKDGTAKRFIYKINRYKIIEALISGKIK